jgi:hypothetical protein
MGSIEQRQHCSYLRMDVHETQQSLCNPELHQLMEIQVAKWKTIQVKELHFRILAAKFGERIYP